MSARGETPAPATPRGSFAVTATLLLGIVVAFLAPALRPGGMVFGWDTVGEHYFWESWVWERYAALRSALWNGHVGAGFPFPAQGTTGVFYPLAFPHLWLAHGQAMDVVLVAHLWLLALGAAALVRRLGAARGAQLFAGSAALVAGPVVGSVLLGGRAQTFAWAWIPWLWLATEAIVTRARWRAAFGGAAVVGLSVLAGQPFATAQALLASSAYLAIRRGQARSGLPWMTLASRFGVMVVVGVGIAAPQVASWLEYRRHVGGAGELPSALASLGALPPRQLVAALFPGFFGDEATAYYWGHFLQSFLNPYLGWAVLVAVPVGLSGSRRAPARALGAVALGAVALALGEHLAGLARAWRLLPGVAAFHFPARWLGLAALAFAGAAALGVAELIEAERDAAAWRTARRAAWGLVGVACAIAACTTIGSDDAFPVGWRAIFDAAQADPMRAVAAQAQPMETWIGTAFAHSQAALARGLVAGLGVAMSLAVLPRLGARWRAALLLMLVFVDAGAFERRFLFHVAPDALAAPGELITAMRSDREPSRYATTLAPLATPAPERVREHYAGIDQYAQSFMHAGSLAGLDALQWGSYGLETTNRLANQGMIFAQGFPRDRRMLDLLNVRWLLAPPEAVSVADPGALRIAPDALGYEALVPVARNDRLTLFENPRAVPRAQVLDRVVYVARPEDVWDRLAADDFDPRHDVVLVARARGAGSAPALDTAPAARSVEWLARDDGDLLLRVRGSAPGFLVVAESDYPGWRARIDGAPAAIERADGALLGLFVPAGEHEVHFHYRPPWLWPSLALSLASALLAGLGARWAGRVRATARPASRAGTPSLPSREAPG
ncbi:MAG: YfhO family protein [bacterium]